AHAWDFTDAPLAMRVFLGGQLNEDGIQFRWVAPTELYRDLGTELGRGRAFPANLSESGKNGAGSLNFFTHVGGDIGQSIAWQTGWYAQGVYPCLPASRAGYRYDRLDSGAVKIDTSAYGLTGADFPILASYKPKKHSLMIDWNPSEFSRIRLQYARDYSRMGE